MFPMQSASVQTDAIKRIYAVLNRTEIEPIVSFCSCYVCKKIVGSDSWSQHSWGNALDLFPTDDATAFKLNKIANTVVWQATHKTVANRSRKLAIAEVIHHNAGKIWTPSEGWHPYGGTKGPHIHVSGSPLQYGKPSCA